MAITDEQRTMLALAFVADSAVGPSPKSPQDRIKEYLDLLNYHTKAKWRLVWGAALFSFPLNLGRHIDNVIFVARNGETNDYAVAIAGTDARSLADWVCEDLTVHELKPWPFPVTWPSPPKISAATHHGLTILRDLRPPLDHPGALETVFTFLKSVAEEREVNVSFTGHSLGGALAPTLALALVDDSQSWSRKPNVVPFSFAGPTPGDGVFAAYFASVFGDRLQRIWNGLDIVPHAWNVPQLQQIPILYPPVVRQIKETVDRWVERVRNDDYTPLNDAPPTFNGPLAPVSPTHPSPVNNFIAQAVHQHISAYLDWGGISDWFPFPKLKIESGSETAGPAEPAP